MPKDTPQRSNFVVDCAWGFASGKALPLVVGDVLLGDITYQPIPKICREVADALAIADKASFVESSFTVQPRPSRHREQRHSLPSGDAINSNY